MNFCFNHWNNNLLVDWIPLNSEQLFLLSFHVVEDSEPLSIIVYPQMIQYDNDHAYCIVSRPPFSFGKISLSSFSEMNPNFNKPIRREELNYSA